MPSVEEVWKDPDFVGLPHTEKVKVMQHLDPDFAALPTGEQNKVVVQLSGKGTPVAAQPAQETAPDGQPVIDVTAAPAGSDLLKALKGGMSVAEAMNTGLIKNADDLDRAKWILKELAPDDKVDGVPQWGRDNPNLYGAMGAGKALGATAVEGAGTALGTLGGAALGALSPVPGGAAIGFAAGGGIGYAGAKRLSQLAGLSDEPMDNSAGGIAKDVGVGTLMSIAPGAAKVAGQGIRLLVPGGNTAMNLLTQTSLSDLGKIIADKQVMAKARNTVDPAVEGIRSYFRGITPAVTEKGINQKAGQILTDNMGDSPIYAQNAEEAAKVKIPGYQPSLAEMRNDPALIKLQRGVERSSGKAADIILEKKAANQAAMSDHLQQNFSGKENVDEVAGALSQQKAALEQSSKQAQQLTDTAKNALNPADSQSVGRNIADSVDGALQPVKAAEREAWSKVPNYPIPSENLDKAAEALRKTPMEADTKAAVGKILDYAAEMPRTTEGMQSIERTINDKMFAPNADPNVKRILGGLKRAVQEDFAAMGEAADKGDVAVFDGKIVHPSKLQTELDHITTRITEEEGKAAVPDVDAMAKALQSKGLPAMKQMGEKADSYAARITKDYERNFGEPLTKAAESKVLPDLIARREAITNQIDNLQPAEDVAKAYRAAKDVSKERFDRFGKGVVADITKNGNQASGRKLPDALIPSKMFTPDGADDFIRAVGKDEAAKHADQFAAHDLLSKANPMTGELQPKVVAQWLNKNGGVLRKYGISKKYADVARATAQAEAARASEAEFNHSVAAKILGSDPDKAIEAAMQGNAGMHGGGISAKNTAGIMQDLVNRLNGNPQALKGLQNAFKDFIVTKAQTTAKTIEGDSIISPAAIQKVMTKYAPAMRVLYKNEPQKIAALNRVAKAVEIQSRSSRSPLGGGSDTAENLNVARSILGRAVEMVPGGGAVMRLGKMGLSALANLNANELNQVIAKALYDPELAQTLMMAAKRYSKPGVEKRINSQLVTLGIVAAKDAIQKQP